MDKQNVTVLFTPKTPDGTTLWASKRVTSLFLEEESGIDSVSLGRLENKLRFFCDGNFKIFLPNVIKLEYGKTYGVHIGQYRIAGFFDGGYGAFIAIDWFIKKKQKNDSRMNDIYQKVDGIREAELWTKK